MDVLRNLRKVSKSFTLYYVFNDYMFKPKALSITI